MRLTSLVTACAVFVGVSIMSTQAVAKSILPAYPYIEITPSQPTAGATIELRLIKGLHSNSQVPTYTKTAYSITASPLLIYPPAKTIVLAYTETWPVPGNALQVLTEYGPRFTLKEIPVGNYTIMDGNTKVGTFMVGGTNFTIKGTVCDDPFPMKRMTLPIPDAKVYLKSMVDVMPLYEAGAGIVLPINRYVTIDSAVTDTKGAYAFKPVMPGNYQVTAMAKGFRNRNVDITVQKDTSIAIHLLDAAAGASVRCTVVTVVDPPNGTDPASVIKPLAGCTVSVSPDQLIAVPYTAKAFLAGPTYTAITDANGICLISNLPLDFNGEPATVWGRKSGYVSAYQTVALYNTMTSSVKIALTFQSITGIVPHTALSAPAPRVRYRAADSRLELRLTSDQMVSFTAYLPNGRTIEGLSVERRFAPGIHSMKLDSRRFGGSVILMRIVGRDFDETIRCNLMQAH
jgi:hypothetical protein